MSEVAVGTAHQYKIRVEKSKEETINFNLEDVKLKNTSFEVIDRKIAEEIVVEYEWLKTLPQALYLFGLYFDINNEKHLGGVLVFSQDYAQHTDAWDVYGFDNKMILLSRGVSLWWTPKNTASFFIAKAIRWLKENTHYRIATATVDPAAGEIGTIYQALNWKYVGLMAGNYSGDEHLKKKECVVDNKLVNYRQIRKEFGGFDETKILEKYPNAEFVNRFRKKRYFYFFDDKKNNAIYENNIKHLYMPYPKREDKPIIGLIYKITNIVNNKVYIGQTVRAFSVRIMEHKRLRGKSHLVNSIRKYGFENFKFEILELFTSLEDMNQSEIDYIKQYNSTDKKLGYNIEMGGRNAIPGEETRKKMSNAAKGRKQSKEWVAKRIPPKGSEEAKKHGRPKTQEEREYLSKISPKYWQGKTRSQETRDKISRTKRERGFSDKQKASIKKQSQIVCKEKDGEIIKYPSINEAARQNDVSGASISRYTKNERVVKGWRWYRE